PDRVVRTQTSVVGRWRRAIEWPPTGRGSRRSLRFARLERERRAPASRRRAHRHIPRGAGSSREDDGEPDGVAAIAMRNSLHIGPGATRKILRLLRPALL